MIRKTGGRVRRFLCEACAATENPRRLGDCHACRNLCAKAYKANFSKSKRDKYLAKKREWMNAYYHSEQRQLLRAQKKEDQKVARVDSPPKPRVKLRRNPCITCLSLSNPPLLKNCSECLRIKNEMVKTAANLWYFKNKERIRPRCNEINRKVYARNKSCMRDLLLQRIAKNPDEWRKKRAELQRTYARRPDRIEYRNQYRNKSEVKARIDELRRVHRYRHREKYLLRGRMRHYKEMYGQDPVLISIAEGIYQIKKQVTGGKYRERRI